MDHDSMRGGMDEDLDEFGRVRRRSLSPPPSSSIDDNIGGSSKNDLSDNDDEENFRRRRKKTSRSRSRSRGRRSSRDRDREKIYRYERGGERERSRERDRERNERRSGSYDNKRRSDGGSRRYQGGGRSRERDQNKNGGGGRRSYHPSDNNNNNENNNNHHYHHHHTMNNNNNSPNNHPMNEDPSMIPAGYLNNHTTAPYAPYPSYNAPLYPPPSSLPAPPAYSYGYGYPYHNPPVAPQSNSGYVRPVGGNIPVTLPMVTVGGNIRTAAPLSQSTINSQRYDGALLSYKEYLLTTSDDISPDNASVEYLEYRKEWIAKQCRKFVELHHAEDWFIERYNIVHIRMIRGAMRGKYPSAVASFETEWRNGKLRSFIQADVDSFLFKKVNGLDTDNNESTNTTSAAASSSSSTTDPSSTPFSATDGDHPLEHSDATPAPHAGIPVRDEFIDNSLFISAVSPRLSRQSLLELFQEIPGFRYLFLTDPFYRADFHRMGFVIYDNTESCKTAIEKYHGYRFDKEKAGLPFELRLRPNQRLVSYRRSTKLSLKIDRIEHDLKQSLAYTRLLDREHDVTNNFLYSINNDNDTAIPSEQLESVGSALQQLNLVLTYLRFVHHTCYYCQKVFFDHEELFNHCGWRHLRDGEDNEVNNKLLSQLDDYIASSISSGHIPQCNSSAESQSQMHHYDQSRQAALERVKEQFFVANSKPIREDKQKCEVCGKMFKSDHFVRKHIENKHQDRLDALDQKADEEMIIEAFTKEATERILNPPSSPSPAIAYSQLFQASLLSGSQRGTSAPRQLNVVKKTEKSSTEEPSMEQEDGGHPSNETNNDGQTTNTPAIVPISPSTTMQVPPLLPAMATMMNMAAVGMGVMASMNMNMNLPIGGVGAASSGGRRLKDYSDFDALKTPSFVPDYSGNFSSSPSSSSSSTSVPSSTNGGAPVVTAPPKPASTAPLFAKLLKKSNPSLSS